MKKSFLLVLATALSVGSLMAKPTYLIQATWEDGAPTWSQATIDATGATVIDLAKKELSLSQWWSSKDEGGSFVANAKEVWVINGTYYWTEEVLTGVQIMIYGGFKGDETKLEDRQLVDGGNAWDFAYPTIVTGEDTNGKPFAHFADNSGYKKYTLDGVTFTKFANGNGNAQTKSAYGGLFRIHTGTIVRNCQFIDNHNYNGKAGAIQGSGDNGWTIENCYFYKCTATTQGGAIYSAPAANKINTIKGCLFEECSADYNVNAGGAVYVQGDGGADIQNNIFLGNMSKGTGTAICAPQSKTTGCTIYNNLFYNNGALPGTASPKQTIYAGTNYAPADGATEEDIIYTRVMNNTLIFPDSITGMSAADKANVYIVNNVSVCLTKSEKNAISAAKQEGYSHITRNNVYSGNAKFENDENNVKIDDVASLFVDAANLDFHPTQVLANKGLGNAFVLYDLEGTERKNNTVGCYEYTASTPATAIDNKVVENATPKFVINGQVYIQKDGVIYNVLGNTLR